MTQIPSDVSQQQQTHVTALIGNTAVTRGSCPSWLPGGWKWSLSLRLIWFIFMSIKQKSSDWKHNEGREKMFLISSGETDAPPATLIKICHSSFQKQQQSFLLRPLTVLVFICFIAVSDDWQCGAAQGFSITTGAVRRGEQVETLIFSVMSSEWNENRRQKESECEVETARRWN